MESNLLLIPVLFSAAIAIISLFPVKFKQKKAVFILLWSVSSVLIIIAAILLFSYLIDVNLKYLYVYSHSSENMSLLYKISSFWAGEEGCFLLWALIMCIGGYFILFNKKNYEDKAFGIYCIISFFIFLICMYLNPYEKISVVPSMGLGLDEILKSAWMIIHPPLIFLSYGAMAVLFCLWPIYKKNKNVENIRLIKLWIYISMFFLTAGIISGCIWQYHSNEYARVWAWDSIENISLIVWLILCGFVHAEKYNTQAVCVLPFTSACFGVFLARSGVLNGISYHSYTESNIIITQVILFFIFGAALFLDIQRRRSFKKTKFNTGKATENKEYASNVIFIFAGLIFVGTIAPIISKAQTSVIYYTSISIAFIIIIVFSMLFKDKDILKKRVILIIIISIAAVSAIAIIANYYNILWLSLIFILILPLSAFIVNGQARKRWRYYLMHTGVIILIIGAIASNIFGKEGYVLVNPGYYANISNVQVSIDEIENSDIIIVSKLDCDTIIQSANRINNQQGGMLISYKTKPIIILFWAGCLILLLLPIIQIASDIKYKEDNSS